MKTQKKTRVFRLCLPVAMTVVGWAATLAAQETSDFPSSVVLEKSQPADSTANSVALIGESPKPKRFSWKAEPLPKCKSFLITEFGSGYTPGYGFYLSGDLGLMVNKSEHSACGLILSYRFNSVGSRIGLKPRFRRWLGQKSSIDLSPGLVYKMDKNGNHRHLGVVGETGLNFIPWVGLTAQLEIIPKGRRFEVEKQFDEGSSGIVSERKTYYGLDLGFKIEMPKVMENRYGRKIVIAAAVCGAVIGLGALAWGDGIGSLSFQ